MTSKQSNEINKAYDYFNKHLEQGYSYQVSLDYAYGNLASEHTSKEAHDIMHLMRSTLLD